MNSNQADNTQLPRIAMVVTQFPSVSQTFIALQIAELIKHGFLVDIFNFGEIGDENWLPEGTREIFTPLNVYHFKNLKAPHEKMEQFLEQSDKKFFRKAWCLNRLKILSDSKFRELVKQVYFFQPIKSADIIHYQCLDLGKKAARLKRYGFAMEETKQLCSLRGSDVTKKRNIKKTNWRKLDQFFDLILPVCDAFKKEVIEAGCKSKTQVIASPVNTASLQQVKRPAGSKPTLEMVSVGRLVEKKGIQYAITMCARMKQENILFRYNIIGDGPLREKLQEQVSKMNLNSEITFMGALPSKEALQQMAKADFLVAPSCQAYNGDSEGIPNVVKEGMALGLQVITTKHSGIPELVKHDINGYLCDEKNPEALFQTITHALRNKNRWQLVSDRAKQCILDNYSPSATTAPLINAYKHLGCSDNHLSKV